VQVQHPYANTGCYLVTNNARYDDIDITLADNSPTGPIKSSYIERLYHEKEIINPGHTGRNSWARVLATTSNRCSSLI
jgi:hypothetical protein